MNNELSKYLTKTNIPQRGVGYTTPLKGFICLLAFAFMVSCKNKEVNYKALKFTEHRVPVFLSEHQKIRLIKDPNNPTGFYFLNNDYDNQLKFYEFKSKQLKIKGYLKPFAGRAVDIKVYKDTIYVLGLESIAKYALKDSLKGGVYPFYNKDYIRGLFININSQGIFIDVLKDVIYNRYSAHMQRYTNGCEAQVKLVRDTFFISSFTMYYPKYYQEKMRSFYSILYESVSANDDMLYSFNLSEDLIKKDGKSGKITNIPFSSNYYKKPPDFDTSKMKDAYYYRNLSMATFNRIIYNAERKEYYRMVFNAKNKNAKEEPLVAWSIIVGDENFNIKYEVTIAGGKYIWSSLLPTAKGFIMTVSPEDYEEKNQLILHEYELE